MSTIVGYATDFLSLFTTLGGAITANPFLLAGVVIPLFLGAIGGIYSLIRR